MPKKQKAKIKQKNKCPEKLIRTEAAKEIAEIDRSLQDQKYQPGGWDPGRDTRIFHLFL